MQQRLVSLLVLLHSTSVNSTIQQIDREDAVLKINGTCEINVYLCVSKAEQRYKSSLAMYPFYKKKQKTAY